MSEEHSPDFAIDASLEQLQQRYPQLADLQNLRSSKNQERAKRFKLAQDSNTQSADTSGEEQSLAGKWLQSYYERLAQKLHKFDPNFPV
jgi:hypothetical protein